MFINLEAGNGAMDILVTGGCGFIGSNFIRLLLKKYPDCKIINIDKLTYAGNKDNLKDVENDPRYTFVHGDICDKKLVESLMPKVNTIVNFAAESHVDRSILDAGSFIRTDIFGMYTLLEAAKKAKIKRFIHISTDEVYGTIAKGHFKETDALQPNNPYSASKAAAELLARSYVVTHKVPVIITRSSNNFGPYHYPEKLMPCFITKLLSGKKVPLHGNGSAVRDWLYVMDNCEAIDLILHEGKIGEVYNIAGGNEKTNNEVTEFILKELEKDNSWIEHMPDRLGQDMRYSLDCEKMKRLGWKPKHEFYSALKETINWYKENRAWWEKISKLIVAGARTTGHAGVVMNTIKARNEYEITAFLDNALKGTKVGDIQVIGGTEPMPELPPAEGAFVAIGNNEERKKVAEAFKKKGLKIITIIHPSAMIADDVHIGEGTFIDAGVVIGSRARIGNNVIIGTGTTVEHDSSIESNVHIAPGVNIDARVRIREGAYIGIGSKIILDVTVGRNVIVGAGEIITKDVEDNKDTKKGYTGETFYQWKK